MYQLTCGYVHAYGFSIYYLFTTIVTAPDKTVYSLMGTQSWKLCVINFISIKWAMTTLEFHLVCPAACDMYVQIHGLSSYEQLTSGVTLRFVKAACTLLRANIMWLIQIHIYIYGHCYGNVLLNRQQECSKDFVHAGRLTYSLNVCPAW